MADLVAPVVSLRGQGNLLLGGLRQCEPLLGLVKHPLRQRAWHPCHATPPQGPATQWRKKLRCHSQIKQECTVDPYATDQRRKENWQEELAGRTGRDSHIEVNGVRRARTHDSRTPRADFRNASHPRCMVPLPNDSCPV